MSRPDSAIPVLTDRVPAARAARFVPVAGMPGAAVPAATTPVAGSSRLLESLRALLRPRDGASCCP